MMSYTTSDALLFSRGKKTLESGNESYSNTLEAEIKKLQKFIGKQAIEI